MPTRRIFTPLDGRTWMERVREQRAIFGCQRWRCAECAYRQEDCTR